jgi:hypothetical protein
MVCKRASGGGPIRDRGDGVAFDVRRMRSDRPRTRGRWIDRPVRELQLPALAVTVAVDWQCARLATLRLPSTQQIFDLFLEQPLNEHLYVRAREGLEFLPVRQSRVGLGRR